MAEPTVIGLAASLANTMGQLTQVQGVAEQAIDLASRHHEVLKDCASRGEKLSRALAKLQREHRATLTKMSVMIRSVELAGCHFDEFGELIIGGPCP